MVTLDTNALQKTFKVCIFFDCIRKGT